MVTTTTTIYVKASNSVISGHFRLLPNRLQLKVTQRLQRLNMTKRLIDAVAALRELAPLLLLRRCSTFSSEPLLGEGVMFNK